MVRFAVFSKTIFIPKFFQSIFAESTNSKKYVISWLVFQDCVFNDWKEARVTE